MTHAAQPQPRTHGSCALILDSCQRIEIALVGLREGLTEVPGAGVQGGVAEEGLDLGGVGAALAEADGEGVAETG